MSERLRKAALQLEDSRSATEESRFCDRLAKVGLIAIRFSVNFFRVDKIGETSNEPRRLVDPKK